MTINSRRGEKDTLDEQILNTIRVDGNSAARVMVNIEGQDKIP